MLRAGLLHKTSAGVYTYLPEGLRLLRNLENHCRKAMLDIGCEEVYMPALLPTSLLEQSDRIKVFGNTVFTLEQNKYYLGPTHEEPVVQLFKDIFMQQGKSSHLLPMHLIQWQNKYRKELRPRGGLLRCKEFLMQDSYSFHTDVACLDATFEEVRQVYRELFASLDLEYLEVEASSGPMGGGASLEFHMLHPEGEDLILVSTQGQAFNREIAPCYQFSPSKELNKFTTKGVTATLPEVRMTEYQGAYLWVLQKDDISPDKVGTLQAGYHYIDYSVATLPCFRCHLGQGNWQALEHGILRDLRLAKAGDLSPDGTAYTGKRGIEIGHIFKLYDRFSRPMSLLDKADKPIVMGCYGIGISRLLACVVLQHSRADRLVLPNCIYVPPIVILSQATDSLGTEIVNWCKQQKLACVLRTLDKSLTIRKHYEHAKLTGVRYLLILREGRATLCTIEDGVEISMTREISLIGKQLSLILGLSKVI
jgi:prolyl-tRNA synthetase